MRRIAVINQKGGVGKTTTTANLAAAVARSGKSTLAIDLDPQGHLSLHFGCELKPEQPSVYDVLVDSVPLDDVAIDVGKRTTLIPSDIDLAAAEPELMGVVGREVILREAVQRFTKPYEYLFIDCPPSLGVLTINALAAVDEVLIPLQAHFFALQGLGKLLETVTLVRQRINPKLRVSGIVLCMFDSATKLAAEIVEDLKGFLTNARGTGVAWADATLFETRIRRNIKLAESASFGKTVFDYDLKSHGAADYEALAAELLAQVAIPEAPLEPRKKAPRPRRAKPSQAVQPPTTSAHPQDGKTPRAETAREAINVPDAHAESQPTALSA